MFIPVQMRKQLMEENHSGPMAGHFFADKLYKTMATHWWWQGMYTDVITIVCLVHNVQFRIHQAG